MQHADFTIDYTHAPYLAAARRDSEALLAAARTALHDLALQHLETVAVAGSLGRLEAAAPSDADCLFVARPGCPAAQLALEIEAVLEALAALGLARPKADGIYRRATTRAALLDPAALGSLDEPPETFGKRMQFLLDGRALFDEHAFARLRRDIVQWYGTGFITARGRKSWTYLVNDLSRYLHAYAAWQQYKLTRSRQDSWVLRQTKLRSVRMVTFAGLMFLLGASNHREDKLQWLCRHLDWTPLERLAGIMRQYDAAAFARLLALYEQLFAHLAEPALRRCLVAAGPADRPALAHPPDPAYAGIAACSGDLMDLLTGFLIARYGEWDRRFFARLLL